MYAQELLDQVHTHVIPITRRRWQREAFDPSSFTRFSSRVGHRGAGKSAGEAIYCDRYCHLNRDATIIQFVPTLGMGMRSWWREMEKITAGCPGVRSNREYYYWNYEFTNSRAYLISLDSPERARSAHGDVVIDEAQLLPPEVFQEVIFPMIHNAHLADARRGNVLFCGTADYGNNLLKWAVDKSIADEVGWTHQLWDVYKAGVFSIDEIENVIKPSMSAEQFAREYMCEFIADISNRVFAAFGQQNIRRQSIRPDSTVEVGVDFNVDPMTAVIAMADNHGLHVYDEIVLHNSSTEELCEVLRDRYPGRRIVISPDQSGRNRHTSARVSMQSDHAVLRSYGFRINRRPQGNPPVVPSIRETNMMLCDAAQQRRLTVDPSCTALIEGLENTTYKPRTNLIDKSKQSHHITDALRYLVHFFSRFAGRKTVTAQPMVL